MTLQEFFDLLSAHPEVIIFFFASLPLTAFLASVFGKGEGHLTPWKQLYCVLTFAAAIPGVFALILNIYLFLFEQQPIMETNIYTQILPILIMILTFWLIRRNIHAFSLCIDFPRSHLCSDTAGCKESLCLINLTRIAKERIELVIDISVPI